MKDKIKEIVNTKQFNIITVVSIILVILFVLLIKMVEYTAEGDKKPPFEVSKITVISNAEGYDVEGAENKWNLDVNQNNDIYIYISKNEEYDKIETIESVKIDNFQILETSKIGEIKLLKTDNSEKSAMFANTKENEVEEIVYVGSSESSIKEQKIANQGGLIVFRYAIENLEKYISDTDEEIKHNELLKNLNINNEDLKFKVSFDITVSLDSKKEYTAKYELNLPIGNVVENGVESEENINIENIKFKRK